MSGVGCGAVEQHPPAPTRKRERKLARLGVEQQEQRVVRLAEAHTEAVTLVIESILARPEHAWFEAGD